MARTVLAASSFEAAVRSRLIRLPLLSDPSQDLEELGDQGPAGIRLGNDGQSRKLEIKGGDPREQPLLATEVAVLAGRSVVGR